jgi:hypothetical protein
MTALVAAPSVSGAAPARVKQFIASISGGATSSFTVTVTNCGGPTLPQECTLASTIGLGAVQIAIPTGFQPATSLSAKTPSGTTWNATYNDVAKTIEVTAPGGSNKLNPGQSLLVTFSVPTATCQGTAEFTTKAWGSNTISGTDPFEIKSAQPTISCLGSGGGTVTGPNGQTETVTGNFTGTLIVTFGGDLSCSDLDFGAQWSQFNLPTQVNITPGADFVGHGPKISTSRFPTEGNDSSLYLICYAVPKAGHTDPFTTRGGGPAVTRTVNGVDSWVGILPNCYDPITGTTRTEPCVSEQFLDVTTNPDQIVISVRLPEGDPFKR